MTTGSSVTSKTILGGELSPDVNELEFWILTQGINLAKQAIVT